MDAFVSNASKPKSTCRDGRAVAHTLAGPSGSASPRVLSEPQAALRRISLIRYDETYDTITAVYKFVPTQDAPRVFSKLRLVAALDAQGLWSAFRDRMVEQEYYDLSLAAHDFAKMIQDAREQSFEGDLTECDGYDGSDDEKESSRRVAF